MRARSLRSGYSAMAALLAASVFCAAAWAFPPYQASLFAQYPGAAASLSNCVACHDSPGSLPVNPFGAAFMANGSVFNGALEALDSDGDGYTNGAELTSSPATNPGNATSRPPGTVTPPAPPPTTPPAPPTTTPTPPTPPPTTPSGPSINYTGTWWNPAESGWGINLNHQGDILFATLFTYDETGAQMWLFMSSGALQADGRTYTGELYRARGPAFDAQPFTPITTANITPVGTMSLTFSTAGTASLSYTYLGVAVSKEIVPMVYGTAATICSATTTNRASLTNYQDMWWNPAESGWGVNVVHQNNILFAMLTTYDLSGNSVWLVMSAGILQPDGSFLGDLYRTTGPAFNAQPFTPITDRNLAKVGTMRFTFADGVTGTLAYTVNDVSVSKPITRFVFSNPIPSCASLAQPPVAQVIDGPTLYADNCAGCHKALASSTKGGAILSRIQGAISGDVGGMGYLSTLTSAQLQAIVTALASVTPSAISDGPTLYADNCAGCHKTLARSTKGEATLTRIQGAISANVGGMGYLSTLTSTQLQAIVTALASVSPPTPPAATDGPALYASNCAGCHRALASSTKGGATLTRIQGAISGDVGGMGYLSKLTSVQLQAIVTALAPVSPPVISDGPTLYTTYCSSCHKPLASSTKGGTTLASLQAAISANTGGMGSLSSLTVTQLQAVVTALASIAPMPTPVCGSCHAIPPTSGKHSKHKARSCSTCHGPGYSSTTVGATHNNGKKEVISVGWDPVKRTCSNSCHETKAW
jgi:mono/diheme cytochrome c family protein